MILRVEKTHKLKMKKEEKAEEEEGWAGRGGSGTSEHFVRNAEISAEGVAAALNKRQIARLAKKVFRKTRDFN